MNKNELGELSGKTEENKAEASLEIRIFVFGNAKKEIAEIASLKKKKRDRLKGGQAQDTGRTELT